MIFMPFSSDFTWGLPVTSRVIAIFNDGSPFVARPADRPLIADHRHHDQPSHRDDSDGVERNTLSNLESNS